MVEPHDDFVAHRWLLAAHLIRLPKSGDFGENRLLDSGGVDRGEGQLIEFRQLGGDAAAFEQDHSPGDFRGMGGEDRDDFNAAQLVEGLIQGQPRILHALKGGFEGARLDRRPAHPVSPPPADAMSGFGQVGQFEKGGEGLDDVMGIRLAQPGDNGGGLPEQRLFRFAAGLV